MILDPARLAKPLSVERATKHHARALARCMRACDRTELAALGGFTPESAVRMSINASFEAWALYAEDDLLAVFGVTLSPPNAAVPWALTSEKVEHHAKAFWSASKEIIGQYRNRFDALSNMVYARNTPTLAWAERLGFKVGPMEPYGKNKNLFCKILLTTPRIEVP